MKKTLKALSALALALGMAGTAQAITLTDLLGGATITVGDKLFADWELIGYVATDETRVLDTDNIDVFELGDGGDYGLQFNILNGELDVSGDGVNAFVDLMFEFSVTAAPGYQIVGSSLDLINSFYSWVPDETGDGPTDAGSYILETVYDAALGSLAEMDVEFSYLTGVGQFSDLSDSASFDPQQKVFVTKNILVWAAALTDGAGLSVFTQRFSQVPEPATALLFGLGLAGIGLARRRRV